MATDLEKTRQEFEYLQIQYRERVEARNTIQDIQTKLDDNPRRYSMEDKIYLQRQIATEKERINSMERKVHEKFPSITFGASAPYNIKDAILERELALGIQSQERVPVQPETSP